MILLTKLIHFYVNKILFNDALNNLGALLSWYSKTTLFARKTSPGHFRRLNLLTREFLQKMSTVTGTKNLDKINGWYTWTNIWVVYQNICSSFLFDVRTTMDKHFWLLLSLVFTWKALDFIWSSLRNKHLVSFSPAKSNGILVLTVGICCRPFS